MLSPRSAACNHEINDYLTDLLDLFFQYLVEWEDNDDFWFEWCGFNECAEVVALPNETHQVL